jgi:hypothetical protein
MRHIVADFRIEYKAELDERIDAAVAAARSDALANRTHGILVTRHDFDHFSVALTQEVPFGHIHEHDHVSRN